MTPDEEREREEQTATRMLFESDLGRVVFRALEARFGRQHKFSIVSDHAQLAYACGQEDVITHIAASMDPTLPDEDQDGAALTQGVFNGPDVTYPD